MMYIGDRKEIIMLLRRPGQRWYSLCCIGRKRHYRKDGTCKHTDVVLARIKLKAKKLVKVAPWGGERNRTSTTGARNDGPGGYGPYAPSP